MLSLEVYSNQADKDSFMKDFFRLNSSNSEYTALLLSLFEDVEKELILIYDKGEPIARACINLSPSHDDYIYLGLLSLEICKVGLSKVVDFAKQWGLDRQKKHIVGPIDINIWFENRMKTNHFESRFSFEPKNNESLVMSFQSLGFKTSKEYMTCFYDSNETTLEKTRPSYDKVLSDGFSFRGVDPKLEADVLKLYDLNTKSFQNSYLYEPISLKQYEKTHIQSVKNSNLDYSFFILNAEGEEVGYVYGVVEERVGIIKSLLIDPSAQGAKLSSALVYKAFERLRADGFIESAGAMVRRGNISEQFFRYLGDTARTHEYEMVRLDIV
jgi:GNAT superfamily N-acetyltransferase